MFAQDKSPGLTILDYCL